MILKVGGFLVLGTCFACSPCAIAGRSDKPIKVDIRFLADSTIVRSEFGPNQDIYLVLLRSSHAENGPVPARLIDEYPPSRVPISSEILTSDQSTASRVRRDRGCDVAFRDMVLRTPPGDLLAILPERLGFIPNVPADVKPGEMLPCYRVVWK